MEGFLKEVASHLYSLYSRGAERGGRERSVQRDGKEVGGGETPPELSDLKMLFPSRRARIFFTDALATVAKEPIWEPEWRTIDEVMATIAQIEVGDKIRLIAELFKIYNQHHPASTFDKFYSWGEILLADFDMVDKYRIDADQLFCNIADIKEIDADLSFLSEQQRELIAKFWVSIGPEEDWSSHKRSFLEVWNSLASIYHQYREALSALGFAYSGMVHRRAVERIEADEFNFSKEEHYVIAGFNALSECEKALFKALKNGATSHFYWDWDNYYAESNKQEAGLFISKNRELFPSATDISHDNFAQHKDLNVVASSSSAIQCKYVTEILDRIVAQGGRIDKSTAIVLTDESLLLPLLYALPKSVGSVNVTMGYPLRLSLAYVFVERLIELQSHARRSASTGVRSLYHIDVMGLLNHPYLEAGIEPKLRQEIEREISSKRLISVPQQIVQRNELLELIFRGVSGWSEVSSYLIEVINAIAKLPHTSSSEGEQRIEFLSFIAEQISTLHNSIVQCGIELSQSTYISLLRRHLQPLRIPFEGEPLEGLQVMGILETRNLDFENVIILSMNDDNFPGSRIQQPSYVPYNLRAAYGLPTPEHHDGVYAYYFYRLIQRAKSVWMLYCSCADDKSTGEQSRYITQLDYESSFQLNRVDVGVDVNLFENAPIEIAKEGVVAKQLRKFVGERGKQTNTLSPTALTRYIACPLRFYLYSIAKVRVNEEMNEEVDAPMFGNILHDAMEILYKPFEEEKMSFTIARERINEQDVERAINAAIRHKYFKRNDDSEIELGGDLMIVREVVKRYILGGILRYDSEHPDFYVSGVESEQYYDVKLKDGFVRIGGICDRIDKLHSGEIRVVDYKSGAEHLTFAGIDSLFHGEAKQRLGNIIQTLLYSYILHNTNEHNAPIVPSLYYVRKMNLNDYSPILKISEGESRKKSITEIKEYATYHEEFSTELHATLEEIFDLNTPFKQCDERHIKDSCSYCDYKSICRREEAL